MAVALTAPAEVPVTTGNGFDGARRQQIRDRPQHADLIGGPRAAARQHQSELRRGVARTSAIADSQSMCSYAAIVAASRP